MAYFISCSDLNDSKQLKRHVAHVELSIKDMQMQTTSNKIISHRQIIDDIVFPIGLNSNPTDLLSLYYTMCMGKATFS